MDLSYICTGNNQYLFYATFYRDCIGIEAPSSLPIDISSASCGYNQTFNADLSYSTFGSDSISHLAGLCPDLNSQCLGGNYTGYEQYIYAVQVVLPFDCSDWIIATHISARNEAITNLLTPGDYDLYVECHLDNSNGVCNNSPVFSTIPIAYSCTNQLFVYNHGAFDPDGDSLVYTLVNPLDTLNGPIPYSLAGFSPTYPLSTTSGALDFDPVTGQISCVPSENQIAVISLRIDEFRDGGFVGSTQRDLEVVVKTCNNNVPEIPLGIENLMGGALLDSNTVIVCPGGTVDFDLVGIDIDGADSLTVTTNLATTIPAAVFSSSGDNPITGHLTWQTAAADSGFYVFTVTISDDGCPISGQQVYSYTIQVSKPLVDAGPDTSICASNPVVQLQVTGLAPFVWDNASYLDDANLETPTATLPDSGTYVFVVTGNAGGFCEKTDTVIITVDPNVFASASAEPDTICAGDTIQLNASANAGTGSYLYNWSSIPSEFSSTDSSTSDNPIVSTDYVIAVSSGSCTTYDTASVFARQLPGADISVNPTTVCEGEIVFIQYNDIPISDYSFDWNFSNVEVLSGTGSGPYSVLWNSPGINQVTLQVTDQFGCSSNNSLSVTVNPTPGVLFESITGGCEPLAVTFTNGSLNGFSYLWDFGDGTTSTEQNPVHTYASGVYDVSLTVTSSEGCVSSVLFPGYIEVLPVPIADASVLEDISHPYDISLATFHFQNNSLFGDSYSWDFGDGTTSSEINPTHTYTSLDTFFAVLTVSNKYCEDTIRIGPIIIVFYDEIFFPTAFSPNSDGINDQFHELQQVGISKLYYAVFNRWGEMIYETNETNGQWDGSYKGERAEVGVYFWYAKADMVNGTHLDRKGTVTLIQ
jgi:gliding motility-associated-like protein